MCTLILQRTANGLSFHSNRDERLDREARPPFWWKEPNIFAPQDLKSGGTWLGINQHNVMVAITNRFGANGDGRRTRGELVVDALRHSSALSAANEISGRSPNDYHGFHLLIADLDGTHVVWSDRKTITHELYTNEGLVVVTEQSFGAAEDERGLWIRTQNEQYDDLQHVLKERSSDNPFTRPWVELDEYGTRSSTTIRISQNCFSLDWTDHQTHQTERYAQDSS